MEIVFEIKDKTERDIHLSKERWLHILREHPEASDYLEEIKDALKNPIKITTSEVDENVKYYYCYLKERESPARYLLVIVKYLNDHGFIVSAYFVKNIK